MKRLVTIGVLFVILLSLAACSSLEGFEDYKKAIERTEAVTKGRSLLTVEMNNTFYGEPIDALKRLQFEMRNQFDLNHTQITDIYYFSGEMGLDIKMYQPSENKILLKFPFAESYYQVDPVTSDASMNHADVKKLISGFKKSWNNLLLEDNIFKGEKLIIDNEDGQIKVRKFSIKPTSDQLTQLTKAIHTVMLENTEGITALLSSFSAEEVPSAEEIERLINQMFESASITRFEQVAHVDMDGYIVTETITLQWTFDENGKDVPLFKTQTLTIHSELWDIEKPQNLDFSDVTDDKIRSIETMNDDMKFEMEP